MPVQYLLQTYMGHVNPPLAYSHLLPAVIVVETFTEAEEALGVLLNGKVEWNDTYSYFWERWTERVTGESFFLRQSFVKGHAYTHVLSKLETWQELKAKIQDQGDSHFTQSPNWTINPYLWTTNNT